MKRSLNFFFLFLLILFLIWESYAQSYSLEKSILYFLIQKHIIPHYEIAFEPGNGIWLVIGWIGTVLFIIMMCYPFKKKLPFIKNIKDYTFLLNIHIGCGIIGAILITFHTTFKLGGIASISFWAMIIVTASGMYGRFIYMSNKNSKTIMKNWLWVHRPLTIIMFSILLIHIIIVYLFKV